MRWDELSPASLDDSVAWASDQPWCQAMADCRQDAGWHSEGDVWTHTQMVCSQLEKPDPAHEVVSLSWLVLNKLLYLFALADTRGRKTAEMGRPEENLHLWRLVAEENGCFDRPLPKATEP